jgi:hypothetical protein
MKNHKKNKKIKLQERRKKNISLKKKKTKKTQMNLLNQV